MGCREQVIVDDAIHAEVKQHKRDLAEAWIDLRKAYDSIHKKWLIEGLKLMGVPNWIVEFIKRASDKWCTTIMIKVKGKIIKSEKIRIRRGIFQGDSLSPLLFCVCIIPVTLMLRKMKLGYMFGPARKRTLQKMITNLLFMDDMKIYAVLISNLRKMLEKAAVMFQTIGLELGEEKCAIQQFKHGKKVERGEQTELQVGKTISYLSVGNSYPYLGFLQEERIAHKKIKEELKKEFKKKCKVVWKSELNAKNKVQAYNELVVAKLTYTFGVVKWTRQELEDLDIVGRKTMHMAHCLHPRSAIERLYIGRDEGGRGLLNILELHDRISVGLAIYTSASDSRFMESVKEHEITKWSGTRLKECITTLERYGIEATITEEGSILVNGENIKPKKVSHLIRKTAKAIRMEAVQRKSLHGQFWSTIEGENASKESWQWMKDGKIDASVEATVMAIQDGVIWTRNYQKVIGIADVVDRCRLCGEQKENLAHLLASCKSLLGTVIKERHDDCASAIYVKACWELGLLKEQHRWWGKQEIQRVVENEEWLALWDHTFATDRTLEYTRPDIVFENKRTMEGVIVEIGICLEQNIQRKLNEKREKYVKLAMELCKLRRWQRWKIVPVVLSVTGIMTRNCDELKNIPGIGERQGRELMKEMQKIVIYKAVNIIRHVLNNE